MGDGWRRGGGGGAVGVGPVWSVKGGVGGSGEGGPGVRARAPPVRGINVGGKGRSLAGAVALKIDSFPSKCCRVLRWVPSLGRGGRRAHPHDVGGGAGMPYSAAPRGARYAGPLYPAPRGGAGQEGGGSGGTLRAEDNGIRLPTANKGCATAVVAGL